MSIVNKKITPWEACRIPNSDHPVHRRMTEDMEEVVSAIFFNNDVWKWMIVSDAKEVSSGSQPSAEAAKFRVDLELTEVVSNVDNILDIFLLKDQ